MEILELENMKAGGRRDGGRIGSSRYPFTVDTPRNREFVKRFHDLHGVYPDMFDGETYEGLEWLGQVIQKAGTDDVEKVIDAWRTRATRASRAVLHAQVRSPGRAARLRVEAVKDPKYPHPIPKILANLSWREGDAEMSHRGLLVADRPRLPAWRIWGAAPQRADASRGCLLVSAGSLPWSRHAGSLAGPLREVLGATFGVTFSPG